MVVVHLRAGLVRYAPSIPLTLLGVPLALATLGGVEVPWGRPVHQVLGMLTRTGASLVDDLL